MASLSEQEKSRVLLMADTDVILTEAHDSSITDDHKEIRNNLVLGVRNFARDGTIEDMVGLERRIIVTELARPWNSARKEASLKAALAQADAASEMIKKVQHDPEAYLITDRDHSLPANRRGGLPHDQASQFFTSHLARLRNMDKSRLNESDSELLAARIAAMIKAQSIYRALQEAALGIGKTGKSQGRSR